MSVPATNAANGKGTHLCEAEEILLRRLAAGESGAFEQLVAEHRQRIARLVYRLLGWRGEVEDVVQDVFFIAYRKLRRFRGESSLSTWLSGIAINRCRAHRRKWAPSWRWLEALWQRRRRAARPDDAAVADETATRVRQAVQALSESDREVIVLYYLEELTTVEMAELLRVSPGAIDVRLHRSRQRLREKLAEIGEELADE